MAWHPTGIAVSTLSPGSMREVHLQGTSVLIVRLAEAVRAIGGVCSHEGGILADGTLSGDRVACPEHGAVFDALTGRVLADPDGIEPPQGAVPPLAAYPTRVVAGMIEISIPD